MLRAGNEESMVRKHLPVTTAAATAARVASGAASVATGILACCGRSEAGWQVWASHCLCVCARTGVDRCRGVPGAVVVDGGRLWLGDAVDARSFS